jgi:hypothetical protein
MSETKPWEIKGVPWTSESQYWNWVRGVLRKGSSRNPVKIEYVKKNRIRVPNPNPNGRNETVWGMKCVTCGGKFSNPVAKATRDRITAATGKPLYTIEINHKKEAGTLKTKQDLGEFAAKLLFVNFEDLEPQCQKCHRIISYSQREGISFEQAAIQKDVIEVMRADSGKPWLTSKGIVPLGNAKLRRQQVTEELTR